MVNCTDCGISRDDHHNIFHIFRPFTGEFEFNKSKAIEGYCTVCGYTLSQHRGIISHHFISMSRSEYDYSKMNKEEKKDYCLQIA
jgi:hypothetical protein